MPLWGRKREKNPMSKVLITWPDGSVFTVFDLVCSVLILGKTGTGKTIYSGKFLAESIIGDASMLILSAKTTDRAFWVELFRKAGKKLHVFSEDGALRFNFLQYIAKHEKEARNIAKAIQTIGEVLEGSAQRGGENGAYFQQQEERYLQHAVLVVYLATGRIDAVDLLKFIQGAPNSPEEISQQKWLSGFHNQAFDAAYKKVTRECDKHDLKMAEEFFLSEMPRLNDRTRSSITVGVTRSLFVFTTGICKELIGGETNISPDVLLDGDSILVAFAPVEHGDVGKVIESGFKFLTQRMVLRRNVGDGDPVICLWCDEYPLTCFSHDSVFLSTCRSSKGCMVLMSQGVSNLYGVLKGETGRHEADVILGQCKTIIAHRVDSLSARFCSDMLGKELEMFMSSSMPPSKGFYEDMFGPSQMTTSVSHQYSEVLQPSVFQSLRTTENASEAIVINDDSWRLVSFGRS